MQKLYHVVSFHQQKGLFMTQATLPANDIHFDFPTWFTEEGGRVSICKNFVVFTFESEDAAARDRFYHWGQRIGYYPRNRDRQLGDQMEIRLQLTHAPWPERDIVA